MSDFENNNEEVVEILSEEEEVEASSHDEEVEELNEEEVEEIPPTPVAPQAPTPEFTEAEGGQTENTYSSTATAYAVSEGDDSTARVLGIIALISGIFSLLCCCIPWMGVVFSLVAIVCGIISMKKSEVAKGISIAGIVCGGIGLLIGLSALILVGAASALTGQIENLVNIEGIDLNEFF